MNTTVTSKTSPWPYAIVTFFIMLALFDAYIVTRALQTRTGTTTDRPYEDSLVYEAKIKAKDAAKSAGLKLVFDLDRHPASISCLGLNVNAERILDLKLIKPDNPALDREISVKSSNNDFIFGELALKPGLWIVEVMLKVGESEYYFESKEIVR